MGKQTFELVINDEDCILELDDAVIDVVDDEWRSVFYDLFTPMQIAQMVGRNLHNGWQLSQLDGWADQPDSNAKLTVIF